MKISVFFLAVVLFASGCLCCGGTNLGGLTGGSSGDVTGQSCESPYIQVGDACCLDNNGNGVCDDEETTDTTLASDDTQATETTETTVPDYVTGTSEPAATTLAPTTTILSKAGYASTYECVRNQGFDPDKVIFGYSQRCGSNFISTASTVSMRTGVDIKPMNLAARTDDPAIKVLECFFGAYSQSNPNFSNCPQLLCPKTGETRVLNQMSGAIDSQMSSFAKACK